MDLATLAVQLICGIAGGNAAAAMFPDKRFSAIGNTAAGVVGGLLGGQALTALLGAGRDASGMIQNAAGSGSGGAILMMAAGFAWGALKR